MGPWESDCSFLREVHPQDLILYTTQIPSPPLYLSPLSYFSGHHQPLVPLCPYFQGKTTNDYVFYKPNHRVICKKKRSNIGDFAMTIFSKQGWW